MWCRRRKVASVATQTPVVWWAGTVLEQDRVWNEEARTPSPVRRPWREWRDREEAERLLEQRLEGLQERIPAWMGPQAAGQAAGEAQIQEEQGMEEEPVSPSTRRRRYEDMVEHWEERARNRVDNAVQLLPILIDREGGLIAGPRAPQEEWMSPGEASAVDHYA